MSWIQEATANHCLPCGPWCFLLFPRVNSSSQGLEKAYLNTIHRIQNLVPKQAARMSETLWWSHKAPWLVYPLSLAWEGTPSSWSLWRDRSHLCPATWRWGMRTSVLHLVCSSVCPVGRYVIPLHDSPAWYLFMIALLVGIGIMGHRINGDVTAVRIRLLIRQESIRRLISITWTRLPIPIRWEECMSLLLCCNGLLRWASAFLFHCWESSRLLCHSWLPWICRNNSYNLKMSIC